MNFTRFTGLRSIIRHGKIASFQYNSVKTCNSASCHLLKQYDKSKGLVRFSSIYDIKAIHKDESWIKKVLKKVHFHSVDKNRIRVAAYLLYEGIADKINYISFFEEFDMPDTFYSWFVITELYVWMLSVRCMAEGERGRYLRNCIVEALWADVAQRVKKLGAGNPSETKEQISELSEQLQAALIAYDEGLQSSDTVLAGALWRRLYQAELADIQYLEELVKYVRKQIVLLDNVSSDQLFQEKIVNWEPLKR